MKIRKREARSLIEAFSIGLEIVADWSSPSYSPEIWFRGVRRRSFTLLPSAYRIAEYDEVGIIHSFVQHGPKFAAIPSGISWGTYALAQHHGVPTRLLDWTDSFSAALFFALDGSTADDVPAVWLLIPSELNKLNFSWDGLYIPEGRESLGIWLPNQISSHRRIPWSGNPDDHPNLDNDLPIAIYPRHDNLRLQTQRGFFTVHGRRTESIERLILKEHPDPGRMLARIDLRIANKLRAREQLRMLGISRSSIYPDLDNFVRDLREVYGC